MKKLLVFIFCTYTLLFATEFKIFTENMPPYNFKENQEIKGYSTILLEDIMKKNATPIDTKDIVLGPWTMGYNETLKSKNTMIYSTAKTKQREALFKWVGPIDTMKVGIIAKKSKNIKINSIKDLEKYKIGTLRKTATETELLDLGIKEENLDRFSSITSQLKKLEYDRIDVLAFSYPAMKYLIAKLGYNPDDYELVYEMASVDLYFAFNKETDDKFINNLNNILHQDEHYLESIKEQSCYIK